MIDLVARAKKNGHKFAMVEVRAIAGMVEWSDQEHEALGLISRLKRRVSILEDNLREKGRHFDELVADQFAFDRNARKHGVERKQMRENNKALLHTVEVLRAELLDADEAWRSASNALTERDMEVRDLRAKLLHANSCLEIIRKATEQ
jgi:malate synthase